MRMGLSQLNTSQLYHCLGQSVKDLILKCQFGDSPCGLESEFVPVLTDAGLCFTFNHDDTHTSNSTGAAQGLSLLMNVESYEAMSGPTMSSGVRVMLHPTEEKNPLVNELAYSVSSGTHTTFAITSEIESRVKPPFGDCMTTTTVKGKSMDYSESQCRRNCTMITTKDRCDCIEAFMTDLDDDDDKVCTLADAENCTKPYASAMSVQARACKENCQVPCKATIYNPVYSFSTLAFVQATQMIQNQTRLELVERQRLAKDFASKVRDIWFHPDKKIIEQLINDFHNFDSALKKFSELAKEETSRAEEELRCLEYLRQNTVNVTRSAKDSADQQIQKTLETLETDQSDIIGDSFKEIYDYLTAYTALSSASRSFPKYAAVKTFITEKAGLLEDISTALKTENNQTNHLIALTSLAAQLKISALIQLETIEQMNNDVHKLRQSTDEVAALVGCAKSYIDGESEPHPPTYLKTNLTEDFVEEKSSKRLQKLSLDMDRAQMALGAFFSQKLISDSVKNQLCLDMMDCTNCTKNGSKAQPGEDVQKQFVETQSMLKSFFVNMNDFIARLRAYEADIDFDENFVRRNILQVDIYYRGFSTTEIKQKRIYSVQDLFSDFGGLMGLCLGASLISILEVLDFLVHFACKRALKKE